MRRGGAIAVLARVGTLEGSRGFQGHPKSEEVGMTRNIGRADRTIRGVMGVAALGAGLYFQSWWGLVGLIFLGTAFISWCPLYVPFRINTAGAKE